MRSKPQKPSFTVRLTESDELRTTVAATTSENKSDIGKFCTACDKFYSYLRASEQFCRTCNERHRTLYGDKN